MTTSIKIRFKKIENNVEIKEMVEDILANYPETRESDLLLMFKVWATYQPQLLFKICLKIIASCHVGKNTFDLTKMNVPDDVRELINPETITRWRRWFNNELGLYLPPKDVREHRMQAEVEWSEKIISEKKNVEIY